MTYANGNSFTPSNGQNMNVTQVLAAAQYPEPWFIRLLGPVQPGAV